MFGQQNDKQADENKIPEHSIDGALNDEHKSDQSQPENSGFQHPGTPLDEHKPDAEPSSPPAEVIKPENSHNESNHVDPNPATQHHANPSSADSSTPNDLIDIKQKALSQLTPLVDHLDQSPEDKFRTTMMMIQASDDQSLVQSAYDAAQKIEDEKTRAQALLDIVNEINYFTQHNQ